MFVSILCKDRNNKPNIQTHETEICDKYGFRGYSYPAKTSQTKSVKNKNSPDMKTYYLSKPDVCPQYIADTPTGFRIRTLKKGEELALDKRFSSLILLRHGQLKIVVQGMETISVKANQMCPIPADSEHNITSLESSEVLYLYIIGGKMNFCPRLLSNQLEKEQHLHFKQITTLDINPVVQQFTNLMTQYLHDGLFCYNVHRIKQEELAAILQLYYPAEKLAAFFAPLQLGSSDFPGKVLSIVEEYLTIEQMSERLCMSRSTFIRQFKTYFKESPNKWLVRLRSDALLKSLLRSDESFPELAERLRFSSQQSMSTFCKQHLHGTPTQIRNGEVSVTITDNP
uniref:Helix-turn-helix domain-containing protein n=1 Tax=Prevotella sp. GTC17259 TaxID=3236795 RepID=A0AB33JCA8_9BACT